MPTRYFSKFIRSDDSESVSWPGNRFEYEQRQDLLQADMPLVGESYSYDQAGSRAALKSNATETVRFLDVNDADIVDQDIDNFKRILDWGIGKIVTKGADGSERWAWGRPASMPDISFTVENIRHWPIVMTFIRSSDFYTVEHDEEIDISSNPQTVSVTVLGNAEVHDVILIVKGPATNPSITNNTALLEGTTTPYKVESTTDPASSSVWLRFNCRTNKVEKSTNSGSTWVDDSDNYVMQDGQLRLMVLKPGVNSLVVAGVTGGIEVIWTDTWH